MISLIKKYWAVFLTMFLSIIALCLVQWNAISQQQQTDMNKIAQQKIIVTFSPDTKKSIANKMIKDTITESSFVKSEHIKVDVENKQDLQNVLSENNAKIDKNNIGIAYVISNFKDNTDYQQLLTSLKDKQKDNSNISLVEDIKANNVAPDKDINEISFNNIAYGSIIIIGLLLLTLSLMIKFKKRVQDYELLILNGKSVTQAIINQSLGIFTICFAIGALALLIFGMVNMYTNNSTNVLYLLSNTKLLVSTLMLSAYIAILHFISNKIAINSKQTW